MSNEIKIILNKSKEEERLGFNFFFPRSGHFVSYILYIYD